MKKLRSRSGGKIENPAMERGLVDAKLHHKFQKKGIGEVFLSIFKEDGAS